MQGLVRLQVLLAIPKRVVSDVPVSKDRRRNPSQYFLVGCVMVLRGLEDEGVASKARASHRCRALCIHDKGPECHAIDKSCNNWNELVTTRCCVIFDGVWRAGACRGQLHCHLDPGWLRRCGWDLSCQPPRRSLANLVYSPPLCTCKHPRYALLAGIISYHGCDA